MATVAGIEQAGCTPVFADIDPHTRCIDPKSIDDRMNSNTRAIMPVHIYGQPAEMHRIMEMAQAHNLAVIEDCSQAHGAEINGQKVGTFADISAFSCYPTKNLGGTGDGGVILCRSKEFAEKIKSLRQYGWNEERESIIPGFNSRLDELQAAILRVKLQHLADDNAKRRAIALSYNEAFKNLPITLPVLSENELHAMHLYVIEYDRRNELMEYLRSHQIGASLHYPLAVHQHTAYADRIRGGITCRLPISSIKEILLYPCTRSYPMMRSNILFPQFKTGSGKTTEWRNKRMIKLSYNHSLGETNYPFIYAA